MSLKHSLLILAICLLSAENGSAQTLLSLPALHDSLPPFTPILPKPGQGRIEFSGTYGYNATDRHYGEVILQGGYQYKYWDFRLGMGLLIRTNQVNFYALDMEANYLFHFPKFPFQLSARYLMNPHRNRGMQEHDFAVIVAYEPSHFEVEIGYQIRLQVHPASQSFYAEWSNILYNFTGYVWRKNSPYNIRIRITNYDDLYLGRTTDPLVDLHLSYSYPTNLRYFIEGQYRAAGVANILFNPFDYKIRLGIVWKI